VIYSDENRAYNPGDGNTRKRGNIGIRANRDKSDEDALFNGRHYAGAKQR
jgi:hypothetical protein